MSPARSHWTVPATPPQVRALRHAVTAAAIEEGLERSRAQDLQLAVSEALTNVVAHAYRAPAAEPGPMKVALERDDRELRVTVCDEGDGPARPSSGGGLGIGVGVMASAADSCEISGESGEGT